MGQELTAIMGGFDERIVDNTAYLPLIRSFMTSSTTTQCELAKITGISRTRISNILTVTKPMTNRELQTILLALSIDLHRAVLAVMVHRDWQRYYDNGFIITAGICAMLPDDLRDARNGEIELLLPSTIASLTKKIATRIAENDRESAERRNQTDIWTRQHA